MASVKSKELGIGQLLGVVASLGLFSTGACGDGASSDCKASRTCAADQGQSGEGGAASGDGGTSSGGTNASAGDAAAGDANAGGTAPTTECSSAEDCDDGEPTNGSEACGADGLCEPGNPPPSVVSVTPETEAMGIDPETQIVITFSEPLDEATVTSDNVKILDGDVAVPGTLAYESEEVTFTPAAPLALLAEYEVVVETAVTDEAGAGLLEPYSSTFRVRDGEWHTSDAVTGALYQISDTLPITATGDALVSWTAINAPGYYCPTSANWFNRGVPANQDATIFTGLTVQECRSVTAGANADGIGAVVWEEDFEYIQQYRSGEWLPTKTTVSMYGTSVLYRVAVSPTGEVSFFQHLGNETIVRHTDNTGVWYSQTDHISTERGLSAPSVAFDSEGNGLAVWSARDATLHQKIRVSRYSPSAAKWEDAVDLPGSVATGTTVNDERGAPAVAVDADGGAMVLWIREGANASQLMASRFVDDAWADPPQIVSGAQTVRPVTEPPALVFDGEMFVAAWSALPTPGKYIGTYLARFDNALGEFLPYEDRNAGGTCLIRMPQLGSDAHGNLLLVWAKRIAALDVLSYARYDALAGSWSTSAEVPGGSINDPTFDTAGRMPLNVNASGLGALMWGDKDAQGSLSTIRLASFH